MLLWKPVAQRSLKIQYEYLSSLETAQAYILTSSHAKIPQTT